MLGRDLLPTLVWRSPLSLAAAVLAMLAIQAAAAGAEQPNIVIILADDLGYGDLGCQGSREIPTPHIDSLARDGVRCMSAYAPAPVGGPSRAALLTGRYPQRFGYEFNPPTTAAASAGLPSTETTLAEILHKAGYATALVGKWHLGESPAHQPMKRGFDEFFGFLGAAHFYLPDSPLRTATATTAAWPSSLFRGDQLLELAEYLTDTLSREAVDFIDRRHDGPFFLYLAYNAPHSPIEASDRYLEELYGKIGGDQRWRTYAAMIAAVDAGVGGVLEALARHGVDRQTLIVFASDNGGLTGYLSPARNGDLTGVKTDLYEGGVRVPLLARWSERLPASKTYDLPVSLMDIFATAVAAAGVDLPAGRAIDGVDLAPYFSDQARSAPHDALYWRYGPNSAARKGRWKLLREKQFTGEVAEQLFDVEADRAERRNLSAEHPEVVSELQSALDQWSATLAPPAFGAYQPPPWW